MKSLRGTKLNRVSSSGLYIFASLTVVICLGGAVDTALAADGPPTMTKAAQVDPLDVPGSFKDLPDAMDAVTAKRLPEQIKLPASTRAVSAELAIDAEKGAASAVAAYAGKVAPAVGAGIVEIDLVDFHATAYCLKGRTASGVDTRPGVIAADPRVLPMGTVVHLRAGRYTGIYTVMDTGARIRGRVVDVYVETHREAMEFGRRQVKLKVIGRGVAKGGRSSQSLVASER